MHISSTLQRALRLILMNLLVGGTYIALGKFGLSLAAIHPSASVVWPPTGFALAMFLLLGNRIAPAIFLGAFLVNLTTAGTILTSLFIALGNMLEGFVGAMLTRDFMQEPYFSRAKHVLLFVVLAGMGASLISATMGVTTLILGGFASASNFTAIWTNWWLGDVIGAITITPLILLWTEKQKKPWSMEQNLEFIVLLGMLIGTATVIFHDLHPFALRHPPVAYFTIPFIVWVAIRFGLRETVTACVLLASIAIAGTLRQHGPFAVFTGDIALPLLQLFIGIVTGTGMSLAAAVRGQLQFEDALIGSEQHFRTLVERSWDVIALLDHDGTIHSITPSITSVLGYRPEEIIGRNIFAVMHPDDALRGKTFLQELTLQSGMSAAAELQYRHHDGSWRWLEVVGTNLLDAPSIGAIVANFRDITQRKREAIAQSHFLSLASHQLRTPITMVRWALENLEKTLPQKLEPVQEENLQIARKAARRMGEAVNSLLTLSHLTSGNASLHIAEIDVREFLEDLRAGLSPEWSLKNHTILIRCPPSSSVLTDRSLLQEILSNLLNNACQYSPSGSQIILEGIPSPGRLMLSVKDEGPGIPSSQKDRIFSLFFRGTHVLQAGQEGSGIGLYVASELTRALGGELTFTSREGYGTTFMLSLPLHQSQTPLRAVSEYSGFQAVPK